MTAVKVLRDSGPKMPSLPIFRTALLRFIALALAIGGAAFALHWGLGFIVDIVKTFLPEDQQGPALFGVIAALVIIYAIAISLPFVPGVEIGIALMMIRGAEIAPAIYLGTVCGLGLAFWAGCRVDDSVLIKLFNFLRLRKARDLIAELSALPPPARVDLLHNRLPETWAGRLLSYRYPAVAVLINLPGNGVIGGGGGICLIAGLSRIFNRSAMMLTIALAVAPVPLLVWAFGMQPWL